MKKIFTFLALSIALFQLQTDAKIIEANNFKEILDYVDTDTLVLLDIDDTLLIPVQTLGTDVWFIHRMNQYQTHLDKKQALDKALDDWEGVRHLTKVKIVEEGSETIVAKMQGQGIPVMGLTTQGLALATCTVNQLKSLEIDLIKTAPSNQDFYFHNGQGVLYRHGILFTSGTAKGEALLKFFSLAGVCPKRVVFINDKETHLKDVEGSLEAKGIEFTGLRYAYSDERVKNFNSKLADIQWNESSFSHILTDQEALQRLK